MTDELMRRMAAVRPGHLDPDVPVDGATRRVELARAMAGIGEVSSRPRPLPRPLRRARGAGLLTAAVSAAAVVALAVGVAVTGHGGARHGDPTGTATGGANGAGPAAGGGAGTHGTHGTTVNARAVLLAAADSADRQPAASGAWWHTVSVRRTYLAIAAPTGSYVVGLREREEEWTPSATGKDQWSRTQDLGAVPASAADRAAWRRAGSPERIPAALPVPRGGGAKRLVVSMAAGRPRTAHAPLVDGDKVFWLGRNVTMKDLRGLPDSPGALKGWLLRSYDGHGTESVSETTTADQWLFQVTAGLITDMPVTPKVRGAAFRMLADLGSVTAVAGVTDAAGRPGTAVAITERTRLGGVLQHRLVIDAARGGALADETVAVAPAGTTAGLRPGSTWTSMTVMAAGWTDLGPR
ncbi:MAG TPA: CU044_5270 family protein [Streptosporangiaceae bacterium]